MVTLEEKWNAIYSGEIKTSNFLQLEEIQLSEIFEFFPNARSAFDIGCGRGKLLSQLEDRGIITTGIDVSSIAVEAAKRVSKATLYVGDFEKFSFPEEMKFDLIFVKFVLAYIKKKEEFIARISGLLNDGGGLVIVSPVMLKNKRAVDEIFIEQELLNKLISRYFSLKKECILHEEGDKKLSLYILGKKTQPEADIKEGKKY